MPHSFKFSCELECDPNLVWDKVMQPALFLNVAAPLVRFQTVGSAQFPQHWSEGEYRGSMKLFGILPMGWQAIVIEPPETQGEARTLIDGGYSPMLPKWHHRITVEPSNGGTRYTDAVTFDAGWRTPFTAPLIRLFFRHRQRRLRTLAANGFADLAA